jgi:hypothetical protein
LCSSSFKFNGQPEGAPESGNVNPQVATIVIP